MGIYSNSVTFSRYRVIVPGKPPTIAKLSQLLDAFKAPKLSLDGLPKAESIGWTRPPAADAQDDMVYDSHWDMSDCQVSEGFMMRVRYERRRVPMSLLQMLFGQKLAEATAEKGQPLGRLERRRLKESTAAHLARRALPEVQFTDVLWRDASHELLIFSASKSGVERVVQLFVQTFGTELNMLISRLTPTTSWIDDDDSSVRLTKLAKTGPSLLARQTY
jgi:DNA recombination-dependent growth factor C